MGRLTTGTRRRAIPAAAVAAVLVLVAISAYAGSQGGHESFALRPFWPSPSQYMPNDPAPNAYLEMNYTGQGSATFDYAVSAGSAVLAHGRVNVSGGFPCSIFVLSPVPALLHAVVYEWAKLVYEQDLRLG